MNPSSHSIYNVNPRKVSDRDALEPGTDEPILPNAMWLEAQTRLRRQTYLFVFTVLLSAVALTSLTTYHYMTVMRGRRTEPRSATPAREQGPSPLGFDASPETLFLYEELSKPSDLPDKGDLPLTVASVRSVAYYLVKAERAQQQQATR